MKRNCNQCNRPYQAQRPTSKYCKPSCRVQHSRENAGSRTIPVQTRPKKASPAATSVGSDPTSSSKDQTSDNSGDISSNNSLVKATRTELEAAGVLDTMLGQQALSIASEMSGFGTAGGMASLSKELSRVMAEAMRSGMSMVADPVDELRARREARRAG